MLKGIKNLKFNSIRFKVGLFYTAVLGVILVLYTIVLFLGHRHTIYRDFDRALALKAQEVANAINSFLPVLENDQRAFYFAANMVIRQKGIHPEQGGIAEAKKAWIEKRKRLNLDEDYVVLIDSGGKEVASSKNLNQGLLEYLLTGAAAMPKIVSYRNINFSKHRLRLITIPYDYKNRRLYLIQVGSSLSAINKILFGRLIFASFVIPLVLVFAGFLGAIMAERILSPVMKLTRIARNITYKDLTARLQMERVDEELRYLVDAFNEMISRLEKSFSYIAQFSSNVAHELKTPLTIIRGESELALMQERDIKEYQRVLKVNQEETDGMLKIIEDLLFLSRLEYQPEALNFERLEFNGFIEEVFEQARKIAAQKNIFVKLNCPQKPVFIYADGLHLKRLFINLLNNAVKFTPIGGKININVRSANNKLQVAIRDTGVGINPEDLDKIFDRFFHIDRLNQVKESGSGLGLSIVNSIVKIHRGSISVTSQPQKGSTFTVTLSLA